MGYGYTGGGVWMWVFGAVMILGVLVLIGLAGWALVAAANRSRGGAAAPAASAIDASGRSSARQLLDERYARGDLDTDEYTERLHTLGL